MSVIPMPGARPDPGVDTELAHVALTPQFAQSANVLAGKAAMAQSAAEAKDFADGALKLVQAIITLDPTRLAGGDTPEARKASVPERPGGGTGDGDKDGVVGEK